MGSTSRPSRAARVSTIAGRRTTIDCRQAIDSAPPAPATLSGGMMRYRSILLVIAMIGGLACAGGAFAQQAAYDPPRHTEPPPTIGTSSEDFIGLADLGI